MFTSPELFTALPPLDPSQPALKLESVLQELPLDTVVVDAACSSLEVVRLFERHPLLPGVLIYEQGQFLGMLSRRRVHEYLLRPQAVDLFWHQSIAVLHSYARTELLILDGATSILVAAQQALRRSRELISEPIVVKVNQDYHLLNIHELYIAYWQIRGIETQVRYERAQVLMVQADKMASLGRLVDGLVHELLDPVSFIWGNLTFLSTYVNDLMRLFAAYNRYVEVLPPEVVAAQEEIDIPFIQRDLPRTLESISTGAKRLAKLATSLQNFCHMDDVYPKPANLHDCLDGILLLLKSRLTTTIQIVRNYGKLPPVPCFIGEIHHVFMTVLTNAVDALLSQAVRQQMLPALPHDRGGSSIHQATPRITITTTVLSQPSQKPTSADDRWASVCIHDNGPGIPTDVYERLLESFAVERRAAKETSLARSYQIITAKHGGMFLIRSQPHAGTEVEIRLPL
ncbi:MAG: ATP-binding protein [Cyanobacteria bacterium]|nr:ATP-binding protein [Cyanobacteriota bacterium]MDW8200065.1 ATP-binding protein [Cyanobacteriota bacterium SKYGB_h_bin112]